MKIKKKHFCRNANTRIREQFPSGDVEKPDTGAAMKKMKDVPQKDRPREKIASKGASD